MKLVKSNVPQSKTHMNGQTTRTQTIVDSAAMGYFENRQNIEYQRYELGCERMRPQGLRCGAIFKDYAQCTKEPCGAVMFKTPWIPKHFGGDAADDSVKV